jgi:HAD superfamily hydrolase (TIGR01509 family)
MADSPFGVIFDLDGTLVASEILYFRATERILAPHGRSLAELTPLERSLIPGRAAIENVRFYCRRFGLPDAPEEVSRRRMEMVCRLLEEDGVALIPGADAFVRALRAAGARMAVASSSPRRYVERVLAITGLAPHFDAVRTGDDVTRYKPDPEIFELARRALDLPAARCVVVEDAHSGIQAGKAASMRVLAVESEQTLPHQAAAADRVVPDFRGLGVADIAALLEAPAPQGAVPSC